MKYLYFSAFAICGLTFWLGLETWARAHREAHQRLLEELNTKIPACSLHGYSEPCGLCGISYNSTSSTDHFTILETTRTDCSNN